MNKQTLKSFLVQGIIGLSIMLAALMPVRAQSNLRLKATVPFDFVVGNERFPAGEYSVLAHTTAQGVLVIRNKDEKTSLITLTHLAQRPFPTGEAMLLFRRFEDQYFLYQVWTSGESSGYELPKSRTERMIEKDLALNDLKRVEIISIGASLQ